MLKLKNDHNVDINFKVVYPIAIRMPEWFKNKNIFFFIPFVRDFTKKARKLNMPLNMPIKPDPIRQNTLTGKISDHQPYIFDVSHMGQLMGNRGKGIEFAFELSTLICFRHVSYLDRTWGACPARLRCAYDCWRSAAGQ